MRRSTAASWALAKFRWSLPASISDGLTPVPGGSRYVIRWCILGNSIGFPVGCLGKKIDDVGKQTRVSRTRERRREARVFNCGSLGPPTHM